MNEEFQVRTDFSYYGNQPKVWAIAVNTRGELWLARLHKKKKMKRTTDVCGSDRVSRRPSFVLESSWFLDRPVRRVGRSVFSLAPKSPADHWLQRHGYQQCPF